MLWWQEALTECQVPQGLAGNRQLCGHGGTFPARDGLAGARGWLLCFGTLSRSSQVPVVPKPCLMSLCRTFNFAFVLGGDVSQLL